MKVLVDYDESSGNVTMENGMSFFTQTGIKLTEHNENKEVLEMLKIGISPDEIIKLKNNGVIK